MAARSWPFAIVHAADFAMLLTLFVNFYLPMNNRRQIGMPTDETALLGIVVLMTAMTILGGALELGVYFSQLRIFATGSVFRTFARGMRLCVRHPGTTLGALCLSLITVIFALCLFMLPAIVLIFANLNIQIGILNGDPAGDTTAIKWLTFAVYLLSGIIKLFITSLPLFVLYYACGSMAAKDEAKTKFNRY